MYEANSPQFFECQYNSTWLLYQKTQMKFSLELKIWCMYFNYNHLPAYCAVIQFKNKSHNKTQAKYCSNYFISWWWLQKTSSLDNPVAKSQLHKEDNSVRLSGSRQDALPWLWNTHVKDIIRHIRYNCIRIYQYMVSFKIIIFNRSCITPVNTVKQYVSPFLSKW